MTNHLPLTNKDIKRVKYWLRGVRGGAISGLIAGTLILGASGTLFWAMSTSLQDDDSLPFIILVIAGVGIFFLVKGINFLLKWVKTKKNLSSANKERISGVLTDLSVKQRRLTYQVDGQLYDVNIVPGHDKRYFGALYRNLFDVASLKQSPVVLDLLKVDDQQFLLLDIRYKEVDAGSEIMEPALPSDNIEGKKTIQPLRSVAVIFIILGLIAMIICFQMYDKNIFGDIMLAMIQSVFLLPAFFVYYKQQRLKRSNQRWIVEGIITEVINAKERFTRGGSYTTIVWCRIGTELVCSYGDLQTPSKQFSVGQKVKAIYLCDQDIRIFRLIEIAAIP